MNLKTARYIFKAVAIIGVPATGYLAALGGKGLFGLLLTPQLNGHVSII